MTTERSLPQTPELPQAVEMPHPEAGSKDLPRESADDTSMTFALFLHLLWDGRKRILLTGLAALLLATIYGFLLPFTYTAAASLVPPGSNGGASSAMAMMGQLSSIAPSGLLGGKNQADMYVGILKSQSISHAMIERFDLKKLYKVKKESDAAKALMAQSIFEVDPKSSIIVIQVTDHSPKMACDLANGYVQALQDKSAQLALTESSQRRLFYEQRLAKEKDDLANAEVEFKKDQEKSGLISPVGQTASEIQSLSQIRSQISSRQVRLSALLLEDTEENPDVQRARQEIASLQAQAARMESGKSGGQYGQFSTAQVPAAALEYVRAAREVKYHEVLFESIAKQYEAARLDEAKDTHVQVLDPATVPDTKSGPHRSIIMGIGLILGLMGGSVWVLFQAARRQAL